MRKITTEMRDEAARWVAEETREQDEREEREASMALKCANNPRP
jgi:hypothetical protein